MFVRRMLAALAVLVLVATGASADGLPEELKARRERLMRSLGDRHDGRPLERPRAECTRAASTTNTARTAISST